MKVLVLEDTLLRWWSRMKCCERTDEDVADDPHDNNDTPLEHDSNGMRVFRPLQRLSLHLSC